MVRYYVGTSGWHYEHWKGLFYPHDLRKDRWLQFYADYFSTVELNNSFYRLPSENAFINWKNSSPDGFSFTVKASRFITHIKRLKDISEPLDTFLSRARLLQEKLGPILYQLPPNMKRNDDILETFLSSLPHDCMHVIEFRNESWLCDSVFETLRKNNIGLCVFDMPGLDCPLAATADFGYIRFHGSTELYSSNYTDEELRRWAERISILGNELTSMYIYFNNDMQAYAVNNALTIQKTLTS
jgi:uncharacterized protein YecE (DUF72 family)